MTNRKEALISAGALGVVFTNSLMLGIAFIKRSAGLNPAESMSVSDVIISNTAGLLVGMAIGRIRLYENRNI
jgi:hypothetical protein